MSNQKDIRVQTRDGMHGKIDPATIPPKNHTAPILIHLENGQDIAVPYTLLTQDADGGYRLPLDAKELAQINRQIPATGPTDAAGAVTIPVIEEQLRVERGIRETGRVRITKKVETHQETIDEPGFSERVEVERVPINRPVDGPVSIRTEGETTIFPVLEEVLVVEKRLILREEIRVTKYREETHHPQDITLRKESVEIERTAGDESPAGID